MEIRTDACRRAGELAGDGVGLLVGWVCPRTAHCAGTLDVGYAAVRGSAFCFWGCVVQIETIVVAGDGSSSSGGSGGGVGALDEIRHSLCVGVDD